VKILLIQLIMQLSSTNFYSDPVFSLPSAAKALPPFADDGLFMRGSPQSGEAVINRPLYPKTPEDIKTVIKAAHSVRANYRSSISTQSEVSGPV
jgi:hypothetical protein